MKLISFRHAGGESFGAVVDGGVIDLRRRLRGRYERLRQALEPMGLDALRDAARGQDADFRLEQVELLPPIPDPSKILCIGLNYESHREETRRNKADHLTVFTRFADTQTPHGGPIVRPKLSDQLDYEGELAVIIGRGGRAIAQADAMAHVAGYACYNDASVRDWQRHTSQFTPGKNFPATGGFGPWLVTADELTELAERGIETRLNGETVQSARLGDMIFPIPVLVAYISAFTPLAPGDVISTGTPGGVGAARTPPHFMKPGDVVEVAIEGVGTLMNAIVAEN